MSAAAPKLPLMPTFMGHPHAGQQLGQLRGVGRLGRAGPESFHWLRPLTTIPP